MEKNKTKKQINKSKMRSSQLTNSLAQKVKNEILLTITNEISSK